jgi:hypothetical protein
VDDRCSFADGRSSCWTPPRTWRCPTPLAGKRSHDLNQRYFREAAEQIGTAETNDFIFGELPNALRKQWFWAAGLPDRACCPATRR